MFDGTLQGEVYAEEVFVGWPGIEPSGLPPRYGVGHVLPEIPVSPPLRINNMHRPAPSEFFDRFSPTRPRVVFKFVTTMATTPCVRPVVINGYWNVASLLESGRKGNHNQVSPEPKRCDLSRHIFTAESCYKCTLPRAVGHRLAWLRAVGHEC